PMILITSGAGFIGQHTAKALLDAGENVVLTSSVGRDSEYLAAYIGHGVIIEKANVLDGPRLTEVGRKHAITGIIHLASGPMFGSLAEGLRDTVQGFINVLETASTLGVKRVSFASSIAIYAGVDDALWREDAPLPMASPYPMTAYKKVCEVYGQYYALRMQMSVVSLRIAAFG